MNWTGGILDRSRNANSSLTAKQKAHFAKARGKLSTSRFPLQAFEIFENVPRSAGTSVKRPVEQSSGHFRPTGKVKTNPHRTSHRRESLEHHGSKRSQRSRHEIEMPRPRPSGHPEHTTRCSPIIISSPHSSIFGFKEDGCISPSGQVQQSLTKSREDQSAPVLTTTDAHRALLLGTTDWIGILHNQPAKVDFTDSYDRSQIGKRRRLSELKDSSFKPKRGRYSARSQRPRQNLHTLSEIPSQADISVRIGSMVDRQSARDKTEERWISKLDHAATVSDEMLLDERFSDRSVISDNPFRKRPPIHEVHHSQQLQGLKFTPSSFRTVTQDPTTNANKKLDYGTFNLQRDPDIIKQGLLRLRSSDKWPIEDSMPIPFNFEDAPPLEDGSSEPRTGSRRERKPDIRHTHASSTRVTSSESQEEPPKLTDMTVRDSLAKPRFFDTSSLTRGTTDYLDKLDNSSRMPAHPAYQPQGAGPWTTCHEEPGPQRNESSEEAMSRPCSPTTHEDSATHNTHQVLEDEGEAFERFMQDDALERQPVPEAFGPAAIPFQKANEHVSDVDATGEWATRQAKTLHETMDEDEALWRSFVFGEGRSNYNWVVQPGSEDLAVLPHNVTSVDSEAHTQPSMEAEAATSPIKQNAHLLEEARSSSQAARTNGASRIAVASNTSQADSDEMLDDANQHSDSALLDSSRLHKSQPIRARAVHSNEVSSNMAQVSISPPTTLSARKGNTIPSSISAQAPTPNLPPQISSDELSWSPSRLSQSVAKPIVVFRKPTRYVGVRSSDPVEPVRLGVKVSARRSSNRKGQGKDEGIWEIGAEPEDLLVDEIEDE